MSRSTSTTHDRSVDHLVVGAGPTGLGAARQLERNGCTDWALVDGAPAAGGLASSFVDEAGFTWDVGGHVQFSHYEYFDEAMIEFLGEDGWTRHQRQAWVWLRNRFVPYPFQNNVHRLPADDIEACLVGLVDLVVNPPARPTNFEEWILASFGRGIADVFMLPYNAKVWAHPPASMNSAWVGERVATADLRRVVHNLVHDVDDRAWGPNNTFAFPLRGGTGAIWAACAAQLPRERVHLGERVTHIDLAAHRCVTSGGNVFRYGNLISTMPLTELVEVSGQHHLRESAARGLVSSSSNIVGLGLAGQPPVDLQDKCWMYYPEDDCPFYRATVLSNFSPYNVPDHRRQWSLMFEVAESAHRPVDHERLLDDVIDGAIATRLITDRSRIVSTWQHRAPYGYPTPGLHRDETLAELIPHFEAAGVFSRGRFGMWKYEVSNQDHSFMQGVEVVERLLHGRTEITAFDAAHANSRKHPWPFEKWT